MKLFKVVVYVLLIAGFFSFICNASDNNSSIRKKAIIIIKRIVPIHVQSKRAMAIGETETIHYNDVVTKSSDKFNTISFSEGANKGEKNRINPNSVNEEDRVVHTKSAEDGMTIDSPLYDPKLPEYRIRTSDVLLISIPYEPDSEKTVPVRPDGRITYLFDIEVMAAGLTYNELNHILRNKLAKYYKSPRVSVIGKSFAGNSVFIMGPVIKPGKYVIHNDTHLLDILSQSGAMSLMPTQGDSIRTRDIVNLDEAYIARGNEILDVNFKKLLVNRDMTQNIMLRPKDFIYIPSSLASEKKVYVAGAVDEPRVLRFTGSITFVEAITEAGGILDGSSWSRRTYIIRGGVKKPKEIIRVNYPAIISGKKKDFELQNKDIIYIPKNPLFYTNEVLRSVLAPLKSIIELDDINKNKFTKGRRMYKQIF